MKRLLFVFAALAVLLAACQAPPAEAAPEPEYTYCVEELEPEPPQPPPPPTREDYIAMLYALQQAFAIGEFEAFIEAYPGWAEEGRGMPGPAVNEWPALLYGVTADMTWGEEYVEIDPDAWVSRAVVQLYVNEGNRHLPSGRQTFELRFVINEEANAPSIFSMMLNTDGRQLSRFRRLENPHFEDQIF